MIHRALSFFLAVFCLTAFTRADIRLPKIFGSHMVLQQDKPIVIWGWGDPNDTINVKLGSSDTEALVNKNGEWKATLPARKASTIPQTMHIEGTYKQTKAIDLEDILVGEVWLCSGQSNMEFGIGNAINGRAEIAAADYPQIRLMKVDKAWTPGPQADLKGDWKVCSPDTIKQGGWNGFTAVGYFFGRELHKTLNVPIGLIDSTWGGTDIQSWTPPQGFEQVPALQSESDKLQSALPGSALHEQLLTKYLSQTTDWTEQAKKSIADKTFCPPPPAYPAELQGPNNVQSATALYNGMIHPVCPFTIRGAIWYQGENNHVEGARYTEHMKALVGGWRSIWGEGDFPFYFVQIAPFRYGEKDPVLPVFWEAQAEAEKQIPNCGMIIVNDIGNLGDIHPKDKQDVGHRLAVRALHDTYGKTDVLGSSPTFKSLKTDGEKLIVTFDHAGTGLISRDEKPITWFEIAGETSGGFKKATANIDGDSVVLTSPDVKNPTAVRFAWSMLAEPNLMNSARLPASAFHAGEIPVHDFITEKVPETKDYKLVYDLDLSKIGPDIHYTADHSAEVKGFDRIAYAVELTDTAGNAKWVYCSMDAFTTDLSKIGVPTLASGAHFQQNVSHLNVFSNVPGVTSGENLDGGNIEFWPNNYAGTNSAAVPNASDDTFDFGDQPADPVDGYGSMQVHNHNAKQTLFSLNHWREGAGADLGIGNAPTGNPDWTFAKNADDYVTKRLRVYVHVK